QHDLDRGILARRGRRRVGVIRGLLLLDFSRPFPLAGGGGPFSLTIIPVAPLAVTPKAPIGIVRLPRIRNVWLLRLVLAPTPSIAPELGIGWKKKTNTTRSRCCRSDNETRRRPRVRCHLSSPRVGYVAAFRSVAARAPPLHYAACLSRRADIILIAQGAE